MLHAFLSAADMKGLEDKQAAAGAGMDPATWSRFKQGDVGMKPAHMNGYLDQCGNELPLAYWAWTRGYILTPRESEMERRLRIECERADKAEEKARLLAELLQGRA